MKPIILKDFEVIMALEGRVEIRRPVKPQPVYDPKLSERVHTYGKPAGGWSWKPHPKQAHGSEWFFWDEWTGFDPRIEIHCPYGQPDARLWVRETWGTFGMDDIKPSEFAPNGVNVCYKANDDQESWRVERWRPSTHMPRWASRLTVEIINIEIQQADEWEWVISLKRVDNAQW